MTKSGIRRVCARGRGRGTATGAGPLSSPLMRRPLGILPLLAVLAACEGDAPSPPPRGAPLVVATLPPVTSLVRSVGGEAVQTRTLLPPGAHADAFEATPLLAEALERARLVVRVGGAADAWLADAGDVHELVLTDGIRLRGRRGAATGNPHVWLDPILVRDSMLPRIAAALASVAPDSAAGIRDRVAAFRDSLTTLDAEIRATLSEVPGRRFVAAHPAWTYFARRYGLDEVGVLHPSPGAELGARDLARLVEAAREGGVSAVIAEPQLGRAGVDALAAELDVAVEVADPVGGEGVPGRGDYLSLMRFNARAFARALGGS